MAFIKAVASLVFITLFILGATFLAGYVAHHLYEIAADGWRAA